MQAWNQADVGSIVASYQTPCFVFKSGRLLLHVDEMSKARYFAGLVDGTRTELSMGARWHRRHFRAERLGQSSALVTVRGTFERPDGTALEDYFDSYLLELVDGSWGFLGDTVHDGAPVEAAP